MLQVGLQVGLTAEGSSRHLDDVPELLSAIVMVVAFTAPLGVLAYGAQREWRRLRAADASAGTGMALPATLKAQLTDRVGVVWRTLQVSAGRPAPLVVCQNNFAVMAHAYDSGSQQTLEVTAGLATRLAAEDPLAVSILRHEMAHLVYRDLPAIRRQGLAAAATVLAIDVALAICALAAFTIAILTDLGPFPLRPTAWSVVAVHVVIVLAALNVTMPLLLGRFAVKRYSGFIVALTEMRADVAAGVWGKGLSDFSSRLETDPTVRPPRVADIGLAYLSPALSHFPARARAAMLGSPERLGTPKLRYFAIAIAVLWVLAFHQGVQVWDVLLRATAVAFIQGLTVYMALAAGSHGWPSVRRAATLGLGMMLIQALPLISIEGIVYLTQDLTAAVVHPGGFGMPGESYWGDTLETFQEFGKFAAQATGGWLFPLACGLAALTLWSAPRLIATLKPQARGLVQTTLAAFAGVLSMLVSYRFFQEIVQGWIETFAFRASPYDMEGNLRSDTPWAHVMAWVSQHALGLQEHKLLDTVPWLRLALPELGVLVAAVIAFAVARAWRTSAIGEGLSAGRGASSLSGAARKGS